MTTRIERHAERRAERTERRARVVRTAQLVRFALAVEKLLLPSNWTMNTNLTFEEYAQLFESKTRELYKELVGE